VAFHSLDMERRSHPATSTLMVLNAGAVISTSSIGKPRSGHAHSNLDAHAVGHYRTRRFPPTQQGRPTAQQPQTPTVTAPITYSGTLGSFVEARQERLIAPPPQCSRKAVSRPQTG